MTESIRKKIICIGGSAPKPPEFSAFRPEWLFWFDYNRDT